MSLGNLYWTTVRREPMLVAYWRQNDAGGTVDSADVGARYGLTGIYSGRSLGPTLIQADSQAASSVMTSGNMTVSDTPQLHITGDISIEAWILPYSSGETVGIIGKRNSGNTFAAPYALTLRSGQVSFELGNGSSSVILTGGNVPLIPSHVVATCFRGAMTLYLDGMSVATGSLGSQAVTDAGQSLIVGEFGATAGVDLIAEVAIYSGALSARRVARHFALGQQVISDPANYTLVDRPVIA